jgi:ribosome-binding factor A
MQKKSSHRVHQVGDQIQKELAQIIPREIVNQKYGLITIINVEVSPDFDHAKVFYTAIAHQFQDINLLSQSLNKNHAKFLRGLLGKRLTIHNTPELHFVYDKSLTNGLKMDELLRQATENIESDSLKIEAI